MIWKLKKRRKDFYSSREAATGKHVHAYVYPLRQVVIINILKHVLQRRYTRVIEDDSVGESFSEDKLVLLVHFILLLRISIQRRIDGLVRQV